MHPVALPETEYATSGSSDESDEVVRVLFGDDKKKDKDKNKKKETTDLHNFSITFIQFDEGDVF